MFSKQVPPAPQASASAQNSSGQRGQSAVRTVWRRLTMREALSQGTRRT
ncbi:MAG: hypothetical protein AB1894_03045 [Chloroflexota bacterium]